MTEKIDTSKLDPATLAKHLALPEGEIGKAVIAEHKCALFEHVSIMPNYRLVMTCERSKLALVYR